MFWLVCYDIADARRLRRVARVMQGVGERVQRSVFECRLSERERLSLEKRVRALLHPQADTVRFYPLCERCRAARTACGKDVVCDEPEVWIV